MCEPVCTVSSFTRLTASLGSACSSAMEQPLMEQTAPPSALLAGGGWLWVSWAFFFFFRPLIVNGMIIKWSSLTWSRSYTSCGSLKNNTKQANLNYTLLGGAHYHLLVRAQSTCFCSSIPVPLFLRCRWARKGCCVWAADFVIQSGSSFLAETPACRDPTQR